MISQLLTMVKSGDGYKVEIPASSEADKLFLKTGGLVAVTIKKPENPGTEAQNRAAHSLMQAYYQTGMHSSPDGTTFSEFRVRMKCEYGPVTTVSAKGITYMVPKSWADYTKEQRMGFIDGLISEIHQSGAYTESDKIREIIQGMENNSLFG